MSARTRQCLLLLVVAGVLVVGSGRGVASATRPSDQWQETRFHTGCDPGPVPPTPWPDPIVTHRPPAGAPLAADLHVDLDSANARRPILGAGFNFEHALWSCPEFRGLFRTQILDPFAPALARVDTGLLPAAPTGLPASQLGPDVYTSMLASAPYADSWRFLQRLNQADVPVVLGVWGGPAQFTDDGTRTGTLEPRHYDDYTEYVATVVDYLVRHGIRVWATTIANEPDGGDGNQIPPDGLAYIAHRLAERLAPLGVKLYGPDTASAHTAMQYLPLLLDDPVVVKSLAFVGFHQYYATPDVATLVDYVRRRQPELPVVVTEYTSFGFGDLDSGLDAIDPGGFTLDVVNTLLSHYRNGVDAAVYWDAVDYLQPGHEAITKWGLLRGPARDFAPRRRYYALLQVLPYLRPGARVLTSQQDGGPELGSLAVRTATGAPAIFLVNQGENEIDLDLDLVGTDAARIPALSVWRTDRDHNAEPLGRVRLTNGGGRLALPPRSVTTLFQAGATEEPTAANP